MYLAKDLTHERHVALKVLKPELSAILGADRFLAEIKVTANLHQPNILPLYDSGEADTFLSYVMPYVEGETLRDKLAREKQLSVEEVTATRPSATCVSGWSPCTASGWNSPNTGPMSIPTMICPVMPGGRRRRAAHPDATPAAMTIASRKSGSARGKMGIAGRWGGGLSGQACRSVARATPRRWLSPDIMRRRGTDGHRAPTTSQQLAGPEPGITLE